MIQKKEGSSMDKENPDTGARDVMVVRVYVVFAAVTIKEDRAVLRVVLEMVREAALKVEAEMVNMSRADAEVLILIGTTTIAEPETVHEEIMMDVVDKVTGACKEEEEAMEEDLAPMARDREELGEDEK